MDSKEGAPAKDTKAGAKRQKSKQKKPIKEYMKTN